MTPAKTLGIRKNPSPFVDHSTLHDETDVFHRADILQWVAGDGDYVSKIVGFQRANLAFPSEQFGAIDEVSPQHGWRRHTVFDHKNKFPGLGSVRKWANVRANGHGNSGGNLVLKLLNLEIEKLMFAHSLLAA